MSLVSDMLELVDLATKDYVTDMIGNIASEAAPAFRSMLILYIIVWGFAMWRNLIQDTWTDGIQRIIKISLIYALVFGGSIYATVFVDILTNGPSELAATLSGVGYASQYEALDELSIQGVEALHNVWNSSTFVGPLVAIILGLIFTGLIAYATFLIVLSKIALAILVGIGPIFILLLFFDVTKKLFESWLQQTINFFLTIVLTVVTLVFITVILNTVLATIPDGSDEVSMGMFFSLAFVFFISTLVLKQVPAIASSLAGGIQISSLGAGSAILRSGRRGPTVRESYRWTREKLKRKNKAEEERR